MKTFFDAALAANLQFFTVPMEVVGLALALIEVRFPATARRLAQLLAKLAEPVARLRSGAEADATEKALAQSLSALLTRVITGGLLLVAVYFAVGVIARLTAGDASMGWAIGQAIAFAVTSVVATVVIVIVTVGVYFGVTGGSDLMERFVAGRAVGTLGIVIAGIGVLGGCYQLATYLVLGP